jgi:nitrous oxidase accessory protein NosD
LKKGNPESTQTPQLNPVFFEQGCNTLKEGDSIVLDEVLSTSPLFAEGDVVTVKGRYTLSSQPSARLALFVTGTRDRGRSTVTKEQRTEVAQGTGKFELTATIPYHGCPHLTFYDETKGTPLGGLYFGTKEQVEEIDGFRTQNSLTENKAKPFLQSVEMPSTPIPPSGKYAFQIIKVEAPAEIVQSPRADVEKIIQHPDVKICEYPTLIAGFGESMTNDQTKAVSMDVDWGLVDGKAVTKEKTFKLGDSISVTVNGIENGTISYHLNVHHLELAGFFECKIENGFLVKTQPRFKKETIDTDLTQKLNSWLMISGIIEQRSDGKKINQTTWIRVISPDAIQEECQPKPVSSEQTCNTLTNADSMTETTDMQKGNTMKRPLILTAAAILAATNLLAGESQAEFRLQEAIDSAAPGDTILLPAGIYAQPIIIRKKITLDGQDAIFKVAANQLAIRIDTSKPVFLKNLEIQYQLKSKPQKGEFPYAVYTSGGDLLIENCAFKGTANPDESPCAVLATAGSSLHIKNSRFDGFNYTIQIADKSSGDIEDCLIMNPGHCGITIGDDSSATLKHNIVSGSRYHGIRCTGGEIIADSNLIIANKNRGFYIGNKSAIGTLSNNLIIDNATGINVFANSKLTIANNVILRSSYAGLSISDTATLDIENNVIVNNERGLVGFSVEQGREPSIKLNGKNLVHGNVIENEKIELPSKTLRTNPLFSNPDAGLFSITASEADEMGLTSPADMQVLWKKWQTATGR